MDERQIGSLRFLLDLSQPLYEQVIDQMRGSIATEVIGLGEQIPSVRDMARALKLNPNTVMRAYQELERDGLTETRRGQGTFVTTSQERVDAFRETLASDFVDDFLAKMSRLGYTHGEIQKLIRTAKGASSDDGDSR